MTEQWQELKETITELRDNDGTGTQQEVCKFLANLMEVLEKQIQEPTGHWRMYPVNYSNAFMCDSCHRLVETPSDFCPNCGAKMVEPQEVRNKK